MNDATQKVEQSLQVRTQEAGAELPIVATDSAALILDDKSMERMEKLAVIMAKGKATVPDHLKGNVGDCMAIIMQAIQWRMNPFAVAQKTHTVNGALGYEAQLVNAAINTMAPTKDRMHYEWFGPWENIIGKTKVVKVPAKEGKKEYEFRVPDYSMAAEKGLGVRVWATLKGEDEPRVLELLLEQASVRNSPLWASDPKQQLAYLAVKRWARLYTPDVILGVYSPDEFEGQQPMKDITPERPTKPADIAKGKQAQNQGPSEKLLASAHQAADRGRDAFGHFWKGLKGIDRNALRDELADLQARVEVAEQRTVEAEPTDEQAAAASANPPPVDDDFVRSMDAASGQTGEYVPE